MALTPSTGCLDVGEHGYLEFEFLTEGPSMREKLRTAAVISSGGRLIPNSSMIVGLRTQ